MSVTSEEALSPPPAPRASLADLQIQREELKALQAREDLEQAVARSVPAADILAAALTCREVLLTVLLKLEQRWCEVVAHEQGETRIHFLMFQVLHEELQAASGPLRAAAARCPPLGKTLTKAIAPRPLLTVSQWADRYRWLMTGTNAPGQWQTDNVPYMREVMDSLSEHAPCRQVTLMKAAGISGTESILNWLGYIMHHLQNKDVLLVIPTLDLRDRSFNPRIRKLIGETPVLKAMTSTASRDKTNRDNLLEFGAGARLIKAGSNSPDSLRSDHVPYVVCDEVDAFPWEAGSEGDPMILIRNRQRSFSRAKTYLVSTPTIEGRSRIHQAYLRSDQRRYHVPCPHCGTYQPLDFGGKHTDYGLKWMVEPPDAETGETQGRVDTVIDVWYECRDCHRRIDEGHKTGMLAQGRWIAENPRQKAERGYHINALYAAVGLGLSWRQIAQDWLSAYGDGPAMQAFTNTYLGEVWAEEGDSLAPGALLNRLEAYVREDLPLRYITAGVDVQANRLEASLYGWGDDEEAWALDHLIIEGPTTHGEVWAQLHTRLLEHDVDHAAIDSGYNTSMVYAFCEGRAWCTPTKGIAGPHRPLIEDDAARRRRLRKRRRHSFSVEPIGVDQGKALIYNRLKLNSPGAGYIHFPATPVYDSEFFAQLAAEKLVVKYQGTRPVQYWKQLRPRNETLDCIVLALAAARLLQGKAPRAKPAAVAPPPPRVSSALR